jgi:1,4-alpha-glucan branching enzyme
MIFDRDPYLSPYEKILLRRYHSAIIKKQEMAGYGKSLKSAINNHLYYGVHTQGDRRVFREWAPNATALYLIGDFNSWEKNEEYAFSNVGNGNWEFSLPISEVPHKTLFKWLVCWNGGEGERIPAYAVRCVQDQMTKLFCAQIWDPSERYQWKNQFSPGVENPLIYEVHIGMSSQEEKVASFEEFRINVLPYIASLGYNVLQIMALQEHPYYGSFGYQVSNFFAVSSRFGTPDDFKRLVDDAHGMGISVVMDIVHSHSVDNVLEGLGCFDGRDDLYFYSGERGRHPAWQSRCFDYGKDQVITFLLSNIKFWIEEYHIDGFRFDGVTSMIYYDHGLGKDFVNYSCYFDGNQDEDAIRYLTLANILIKEMDPSIITIAEDVSGMPGLAAPFEEGGVGFDFRMSMGIADHWIKWIKELRDEDWSMGSIYYELTNKRGDEKTISYTECHDQALVGDKTIIFRLIDKEMYFSMDTKSQNIIVERGIALHKMIRLVTLATAGDGYLNFMGNEFGHPEWIDFPREGNGWSYKYARRLWSLKGDTSLRYHFLLDFDKSMISLFKKYRLLRFHSSSLLQDEEKKVLIFERGNFIFAFNFNPLSSFSDFSFNVTPGGYKVVLDSDNPLFGGYGRNDKETIHFTSNKANVNLLSLYLPSRSVIMLKKID